MNLVRRHKRNSAEIISGIRYHRASCHRTACLQLAMQCRAQKPRCREIGKSYWMCRKPSLLASGISISLRYHRSKNKQIAIVARSRLSITYYGVPACRAEQELLLKNRQLCLVYRRGDGIL